MDKRNFVIPKRAIVNLVFLAPTWTDAILSVINTCTACLLTKAMRGDWRAEREHTHVFSTGRQDRMKTTRTHKANPKYSAGKNKSMPPLVQSVGLEAGFEQILLYKLIHLPPE